MTGRRLTMAAAAALLLAACEAKVGDPADNAADGTGRAGAGGKAEEGKVAIKAPGFELSLNIPEEMAGQADHQGKLLYPGATVSGVYVAGDSGGEGGEVELRFRTDAAPEAVAAWYQEQARANDFTLSSFGREGVAYVGAGQEKKDQQNFRLRLEPRQSGGTDGRLVIRDRG